ncbi:response regulator, partial [Arthrospira platensis SPKY2]
MNGEIGLESQAGAGSLFWFTARLEPTPDADEPQATTRTAVTSTPPKSPEETTKLSILVAEDNLINRRLMEALLRQMGHDATFAENGQIAVACRAERNFDLVLMDMQMPVMDGLSATRAIRKYESLSGIRPVPIFAL